MAYLEGIAVYLATALGFVSLLMGLFAASIYRRLDENAETAMARFHLNVDRSRWEFRIWLLAGLLILAGSVFFIGSSYTELFLAGDGDQFRNLGRIGFIAGVTLSMVTLGSWWRRF